MHPKISAFPSQHFYQGQLRGGQNVAKRGSPPWGAHALFGPVTFWDVGNSGEVQAGESIKNPVEAAVVAALINALQMESNHARATDRTGEGEKQTQQFQVGVITPYRAQISELHAAVARIQSRQIDRRDLVEINTVDGFQGREKDIIIVSCVRSSPDDSARGIGFLSDVRRMNVALVRHVFECGMCSATVSNESMSCICMGF
eukprot:SAG31_NODE_8614_length_1419_cov_1.435606_1_plen_202_part_00